MIDKLIAPCGMNCNLCYAYQRDKNKCLGCNIDISRMPNSCLKCIIRNCDVILNSDSGFCYECEQYPCRRLKDLDKRYRTKYHMSMLENLEFIRAKGLQTFVSSEGKRWACPHCGSIICIHHKCCSKCNYSYKEQNIAGLK